MPALLAGAGILQPDWFPPVRVDCMSRSYSQHVWTTAQRWPAGQLVFMRASRPRFQGRAFTKINNWLKGRDPEVGLTLLQNEAKPNVNSEGDKA